MCKLISQKTIAEAEMNIFKLYDCRNSSGHCNTTTNKSKSCRTLKYKPVSINVGTQYNYE